MGDEVTDCNEMKRIIEETEEDAIIMFGVALGITIDDFKRLFQNPKKHFQLQ